MLKKLVGVIISLFSLSVLANSPVPLEINGQKALVFINQDPPGTRCNTNVQIAAEIANAYRLPILILPQIEGTTKQKKQGKLFNDSVRPEFDKFKSTIKTGK